MRRGIDPKNYPIYPNDRRGDRANGVRAARPRRTGPLALMASLACVVVVLAIFFR